MWTKKINWINCNKLDFFLLLYGKIHFVVIVNNLGAILHKVLVKSQGIALLSTYVFCVKDFLTCGSLTVDGMGKKTGLQHMHNDIVKIIIFYTRL